MSPINLQDRAQYLSLALFAQGVVAALMEYADENKSGRLKNALGEALDSLRHSKRPAAAPQRRVAAFTTYEQLRTLQEVWTAKDREKAIRLMKTVLRSPESPKSKKAVANELIGLFSDLQNQALWNFEQPKPVSPKVMQRLCQQG